MPDFISRNAVHLDFPSILLNIITFVIIYNNVQALNVELAFELTGGIDIRVFCRLAIVDDADESNANGIDLGNSF